MSGSNEASAHDAARGVVAAGDIRRKVRRPGKVLVETISTGKFASSCLLALAASIVLFPPFFVVAVPAAFTYYLWLTGLRFRLPFRVPITWPGVDWSQTSQSGKAKKPGGIFYGGSAHDDGQHLVITNDDARRHILVMGTTGSGKALPDDALVLTPIGWRLNCELSAGDALCHPDGSLTFVESVHPQGVQRICRLEFEDGRVVECTPEHLWRVSLKGNVEASGYGLAGETNDGQWRVVETRDLGLLLGVHGDQVEVFVQLIEPYPGLPGSQELSMEHGRRASDVGIAEALGQMPDQLGSVDGRRAFLAGYLEATDVRATHFGIEASCRSKADARALRQLVWSLGGLAMVVEKASARRRGRWVLRFHGPGFDNLVSGEQATIRPFEASGVRLVSVDPTPGGKSCRCIRTTRADGLYVTDGYVTTHNTELMLGYVAQSLMWSSSFAFIDGKGANDLYPRVWSLAKRFGREDDVRLISFKNPETMSDAAAGGPEYETNTLNPFSKGSEAELRNIIDSLMGESSGADSMWRGRAATLVSAVIRILVSMRDRNEILLDVQAIRDYLPLGVGIKRDKKAPAGAEEPTEAEWRELADRPGLIELYLRALHGDFSEASKLQLKAFFDTLPGFNLQSAMTGKAQEGKTLEQYGYLSMQLTKPLGTLADDFAHVFRTALGEVDMEDVVQNRRILVVLLPALEKAPEEMKNLGRVIVSLFRIMMGKAAGGTMVGTKEQVIESKPTVARMPFILVLDEAGYYLTKGVDTMFAQGRSLGFQQIVGLQDVTAMKESAPHLLDTVTANTNLFAIGKTVDSSLTYEFVRKRVGTHTVAVSSGYSAKTGLFATKYVDRGDVTFKEEDRIPLPELNGLEPGEFYYLYDGILIKANCFYVGDGIKNGKEYADTFDINKFLAVRGPRDRAPNLDQKREIAYESSVAAVGERLGASGGEIAVTGRVCAEGLMSAAGTAAGVLARARKRSSKSGAVDPFLVAVAAGGLRQERLAIEGQDDGYDEGELDDEMVMSGDAFHVNDDEDEADESGGGVGLRNRPPSAGRSVPDDEAAHPASVLQRPPPGFGTAVKTMLDEDASLADRAIAGSKFIAINPFQDQPEDQAVKGKASAWVEDAGSKAMAERLLRLEGMVSGEVDETTRRELEEGLQTYPSPSGIAPTSPERLGRMLNVLESRLSQ